MSGEFSRRELLGLSGLVITPVAGLYGIEQMMSPDVVVDESVPRLGIFNFDAEEGDLIEVALDVTSGGRAETEVNDPDGDSLVHFGTATSATRSREAPKTGTYGIAVQPGDLGGADLTVRLS